MKKLLTLFFTMMKIGAFTFGGGYAMIALLQNEFVEKKKWISDDEFSDLVAIAESTPGPIAINSSTYIGYKVGGLAGAFFGTLAMCIPSFVIIYLISLFFEKFLSLTYVSYAFRGIQACVCWLILSAGVKMFKKLKKNVFNVTLLTLTVAGMILTTLFCVSFSSVFYILIGGAFGVFVYLIASIRKREKSDKEAKK